MSRIITEWEVNLGETSANLNKTAADVANLAAAIEAAKVATIAGAKQSAEAIAVLNNGIIESANNRRLEQEALKRSTAEVAVLKKTYADLSNQFKTDPGLNATETINKLKSISNELQRNRKEQVEINKAIAAETAAIDKAKAAIDKETAAQKQLTEAARLTEKAQQEAAKAADKAAGAAVKAATQAGKAAEKAAAAGAEGAQKTSGAFGGLGNAIAGAGSLFAGVFAFNQLKQLGAEIISVTAEFQRYEAVLTTIFEGNNGKAKRQFSILEDFASKTPFQIGEVTDAYVQLQQRGLKPTEAQLTALGDLAASSGKGFLQVSEAVLNAQVGIFRNLKQFGVTASVDGDKVRLTYKDITTELEKGSEALSQYLLNLGATAGVAGSMDKISATLGGQISNLKDNFTELFAVIGEGNTGVISNFIKGLSVVSNAVKEYLKSNSRLALDASVTDIKIYDTVIAGRFEAIIANAKANGQSVAQATGDFARQQDKLIVNQLRKANAIFATFQAEQKEAVKRNTVGFDSPSDIEMLDRNGEVEVLLRSDIEKLKAARSTLTDLAKGAAKSNKAEVDNLGLIATLKDKILKLDEKRNAESTTRAQLLDKGGLNDQKDVLEKELAVLEGKKEKVAKERGDKLKAALAALQAAELALHKEHNKAVEADAKQNATALAKIQLTQDIEAIAQLKKTVIEKEKAVKAAGGRGASADGKLNAKQQAEFDDLENLARKQFGNKIADIERETNARVLDLQRESNEKELAQLTAKFNEEIRLATQAENKRLVIALQGAKERAEALLIQSQKLRDIDQDQQLGANAIRRGGGEVVANLPTADSTLTERLQAKIAAARIDAEKNMQRELLVNEIKFNKARLATIIEDGTKVTKVKRDDLATIIQDQELALAKTRTNASPQGFLLNILGVKPEDRDEASAAFDQFASVALTQINDFAAAQVEAARAVADDAQRRVEEKRSELDQELALNREGFASNVETKRQELAEAKRNRAEALKDQKDAQRAQIALDSALQISNLVTASTDIFKATAKLGPIGVALSIGTVAVMVGAFLAAKTKALQAVNAQSLESGGYIGGRRHSQGGNKFVSQDGLSTVEHEAGEFVVKRRATSKYGHLLESINAEDENKMIQILFNDLLKGTGITPPARTLPQQLQQAQAAHGAATAAYSSQAANSRIEQLSQDVAAIRANTQPQQTTTDTGTHLIYTDGNRTRIERK